MRDVYSALEYFQEHKPRVFYLSLGETDEWGHAGRYDEYLASAKRADSYVKTLWDTAQSMPSTRGKRRFCSRPITGAAAGLRPGRTMAKTLRGRNTRGLPFSARIRPLGQRTNVPEITQGQIAATIAAFLGQDFHAAVPQSAKPIRGEKRGHSGVPPFMP